MDRMFQTPTMAKILREQGDEAGARRIQEVIAGNRTARPTSTAPGHDPDLEWIHALQTWLQKLKESKHGVR